MESKVILKEKNPQDESNVIVRLFLTWNFKLFRRGYKQGLTISDLCKARNGDESGPLGDRLEEAWEAEVENAKKNRTKPSLSNSIVRAFWLEYMMSGFFVAVMFVVVWPLIPYTLAIFIEYFSEEITSESYRDAHIYNFLMNLCSVLSFLLYNQTQLTQGRTGMRVRVACCSLMYRKILKLNHIGLGNTEVGQVINLMSNDVSRFDLVALFLNYAWVAPISAPVVSYLIWEHIGVATLASLLVIFLQTVFGQVYLSSVQGKYRGKIAKRTDERVKVMSELISGVQVIKMYAWEKPFEKLVDKLRKVEVSFILKTSIVKGISVALGVFTERFILFVAVVTYVLMGGVIRAQTAFALAQYFNLMQLTCNILLPYALGFLAEANVSIRRIEEFLLLEETEASSPTTSLVQNSKFNLVIDSEKEALLTTLPQEEPKSLDLSLSNVTASWQDDAVVDTLRNINITAKPGQFIGIAGPVGSGKSSLLHLILGELKTKKGTVSMGTSRLSYASQEPWLFAGTVKENILFGLPYDPARYKKVVEACALSRDLELFPHGDATLVGERGISVSGGQRARISLARACYRQADIYLLDDPLSAVDTKVGKHLVSECVEGLLGNSIRILVTHQLHHLKNADKIVVLRHGEIEIKGTFENVSSSPLFGQLLSEDDVEEPETALIPVKEHIDNDDGGKENSDEPEQQEEAEEMSSSGRVPGTVYVKYFRSGGSWSLLSFTVFSMLLAQLITSVSDLWLTHWMNDVEAQYIRHINSSATVLNLTESSLNTTASNFIENLTTLPPIVTTVSNITNLTSEILSNITDSVTIGEEKIDNMYYVKVWTMIIFGCIILTTGRSILFLWVCMRSSIKLHNRMFSNILSATMRFFDTNPSGRILNRFSKDMGVVDEILPRMYLECLQIFLVMLGILVMVAIVNPYMLLTTVLCAVVMYFWTALYLTSAQAIKRLEGVARSPVFTHVTATMAGLSTVRVNDAQHLLTSQFDDKQDVHSAAWYLTIAANACYAIWLSVICSFYVMMVAYSFLLLDDGTTQSGNVGLAISQALILVNMVQYGVKQGTDMISQMTCVERIIQFTSLPQENTQGNKPAEKWPQQAKLEFKDLSLRYSEDVEPVLKKLNITIESGWKVGVVGRTGAGKSSLIAALFRLAPTEGEIYIDGINTMTIGLKELRSKIAIIPQEPVLFSASLRYNMDPFDKYSDDEIWRALEQVELKSSVTSLSAPVATGGTNFSAGQRQLLCLARAALARNKLLVLDEATANVDASTDAMIQKSIRKHFADCTVITVAHRLHTVADSDRIIVMEAGKIVECGHPCELLEMEDGHFTKMVKQLGGPSQQTLREIAKTAYSEHNLKNTK